ncbi:MAG: BppU family phage baseplate upper protein [Nitrospirae bacterium]|nr:BppU family phage baseplate upper protein [Nitrospirota bacterium]
MALKSLTFTKGDKRILRIQVKENGTPKNITGMTFKFGVKENLADASYKIGPVTGVIDDVSQGHVSFTFNVGTNVFSGVYEVAMYDAAENRTTLTPAGGLSFRAMENIID